MLEDEKREDEHDERVHDAEEEPEQECLSVEYAAPLSDVVHHGQVLLVDLSVFLRVDVLVDECLHGERERGEEEVVEADVPVVVDGRA